jgi:hypothetical protein
MSMNEFELAGFFCVGKAWGIHWKSPELKELAYVHVFIKN